MAGCYHYREGNSESRLYRVAAQIGIECYETPTGWKFFGNLLDAGLDPQQALASLIPLAEEIAQIRKFTGREQPTVIT
jgi:Phosphoglucomutase/phosphomannomutase, alpha/beta/alpha domain III